VEIMADASSIHPNILKKGKHSVMFSHKYQFIFDEVIRGFDAKAALQSSPNVNQFSHRVEIMPDSIWILSDAQMFLSDLYK
jgi:hypothetical protein